MIDNQIMSLLSLYSLRGCTFYYLLSTSVLALYYSFQKTDSMYFTYLVGMS